MDTDDNTPNIEDCISELKRAICTIGWDIPNIKNKELKEIKTGQITQYKKELDELLRLSFAKKEEQSS